MVIVKSFLKSGSNLVPVEEFAGPIADDAYIEGAIELSIDHAPILTCELVDYVDQLWGYLTAGLGEVIAGREFSTYYPDMSVQIVLRPQGGDVTVIVDPHQWNHVATAPLGVLVCAMASAGTMFFDRMRQYVPNNRTRYDRNISRLATLAASVTLSQSEQETW